MTQTSHEKVKLVNLVACKCNLISKGKVKIAAISVEGSPCAKF